MKRQGGNTSGQPPVKKPDASTDLRSKIGAKLQTLLNGIDTDAVLSAKRRKQLYEDLFGKPKYSEIIIDPTIVIKEEPDVEESSNDSSTLLNSRKFLLSAKSRLTELLNKQQDGTNKYKDSGKENTLFSNRNKSSSGKSSSSQTPSCSKLQSRSCNSLNNKKSSTNKEYSNSSSDSLNNEIQLKKLVVVLDDCMNSNFRETLSSTKRPANNKNSSNLEPNCVDKQDGCLTSLKKPVTRKSNNITDLCLDRKSKSCKKSEISRSKSLKSSETVLSNNPSPSKIMGCAYGLNSEECGNNIPYYNENESEMIDDPIIPQVIVDIKIGESLPIGDNFNFGTENYDSEVELLCVKKPTAEVITLEDNEDEEEVVDDLVSEHEKGDCNAGELIHKCKQCGKSFRAESLLNFHVRMHGNNLIQSTSSSSHSFS